MKRHTLLVIGIILILITSACSLSGCLASEEGSQAASSSFQFDSQGPQIASLETLDSYRAYRTVWLVKENSCEEINTTAAECVREPLAIHVAYHNPETGFEEQVAIGNTVWDKKAPGMWEKAKSGHRVNDAIAAAETFWGFTISEIEASLCSDCTVLVDKETVNGIHCRHYVLDRDVPTLHVEAWVADQIDLPPVLIRGLRREMNKDMTIYTEVNLTDINKPFIIEPPE
jgi:hypothetical protein